MATQPGTNFFAPVLNAPKVLVALTDEAGNCFLVKCLAADIPSGAAGYAVGCILVATDTGTPYKNTGSTTSCTFGAI